MVGLHLVPGPVGSYRDAAVVDKDFRRLVHTAMLVEGLFAAPRLMFCTSTPMDEAVIDEVLLRFRRALDRAVA
jgi:glutamate-1-semialdehyde aminotransferase